MLRLEHETESLQGLETRGERGENDAIVYRGRAKVTIASFSS